MNLLPLGEPNPPKPILPSVSLGLDELFVTGAKTRFGAFMPVLEVKLGKRGAALRPAAIFSLS